MIKRYNSKLITLLIIYFFYSFPQAKVKAEDVHKKINNTNTTRNLLMPKIIDGIKMDIEYFPYMVSIQYSHDRKFQSYQHTCGGTILSDQIIMTAAHCFHNLNKRKFISFRNFAVGAGKTKQSEFKNLHKVIAFKPHPWYGNTVQHHADIALLLIDPPLKFNSRIQPTKLFVTHNVTEEEENTHNVHNVTEESRANNDQNECIAIGWGRTVKNLEEISNDLMQVQLSQKDPRECLNVYPEQLKWTDKSEIICAMNMITGDTCKGDSGGPLICDFVVEGITSFGFGCNDKLPGVYTRIRAYSTWIKATMKSVPRSRGILSIDKSYSQLHWLLLGGLVVLFKY